MGFGGAGAGGAVAGVSITGGVSGTAGAGAAGSAETRADWAGAMTGSGVVEGSATAEAGGVSTAAATGGVACCAGPTTTAADVSCAGALAGSSVGFGGSTNGCGDVFFFFFFFLRASTGSVRVSSDRPRRMHQGPARWPRRRHQDPTPSTCSAATSAGRRTALHSCHSAFARAGRQAGINDTFTDSLPLATRSSPFWNSVSGSWWRADPVHRQHPGLDHLDRRRASSTGRDGPRGRRVPCRR